MKRLCAFFLLLFYVASVSGASFNLHFCGNKLNTISFAGFGKKGCCCKKPMSGKNCCKDKQVSLKSVQVHKGIEGCSLNLSVPKQLAAVPHSIFLSASLPFSPQVLSFLHPPPIRAGDQHLFLLNGTFRI